MPVDEHLFVVDQVLHRAILVEQVGVEGADHVGADRANHAVDDVAVSTDVLARRGVGLCPSSVRVVVAADDMHVGVGALPAGIVCDQVQVAKPQAAQAPDAQAFFRVS